MMCTRVESEKKNCYCFRSNYVTINEDELPLLRQQNIAISYAKIGFSTRGINLQQK